MGERGMMDRFRCRAPALAYAMIFVASCQEAEDSGRTDAGGTRDQGPTDRGPVRPDLGADGGTVPDAGSIADSGLTDAGRRPFSCSDLSLWFEGVLAPGDTVDVQGVPPDASFRPVQRFGSASIEPWGARNPGQDFVRVAVLPDPSDLDGDVFTSTLDLFVDGTECTNVGSFQVSGLPDADPAVLDDVVAGLDRIQNVFTRSLSDITLEELVASDPEELDDLTRSIRGLVILNDGQDGVKNQFAALDDRERRLVARGLAYAGIAEVLEEVAVQLEAAFPPEPPGAFNGTCGTSIGSIETRDQLDCWMQKQSNAAIIAPELSSAYATALGLVVAIVTKFLGPAGAAIDLSVGVVTLSVKLAVEMVEKLAPGKFVTFGPINTIDVQLSQDTFEWTDESVGRFQKAEVTAESQGWKLGVLTIIEAIGVVTGAAGFAGNFSRNLDEIRDLSGLSRQQAVNDALDSLRKSVNGESLDAGLGILTASIQTALGLQAQRLGEDPVFTVWEFAPKRFGPFDISDEVDMVRLTPAPRSSFEIDTLQRTYRVSTRKPLNVGTDGLEFRLKDALSDKYAMKNPRARLEIRVTCPRVMLQPRAPFLDPEEEVGLGASVFDLSDYDPDDLRWSLLPSDKGSLDKTTGKEVRYTAPADRTTNRVRILVEYIPRDPPNGRNIEEECPTEHFDLGLATITDCCSDPEGPGCDASVRCFCEEPPFPDECAPPPDCDDPDITQAGGLFGPAVGTWVNRSSEGFTINGEHIRDLMMLDLVASPVAGPSPPLLQVHSTRQWPRPFTRYALTETSTTRRPVLSAFFGSYFTNETMATEYVIDFKRVESSTVTRNRRVEGEYFFRGAMVRGSLLTGIEEIVPTLIRGCFDVSAPF